MLRFYFITDESGPRDSMIRQVEIAISAGATIVQYRHKTFSLADFKELGTIRDLCRRHLVPLIINDNILLAKAVDADGVHLGQADEGAGIAREIMGADAIIGISVSTPAELEKTDLRFCNYIGTGPVFATTTKADASPVIGLAGLQAVTDKSSVPVVAIGGIDAVRAGDCFSCGAAGIAVITCITRATDPVAAANRLAAVCGCLPVQLKKPWENEFALIDKLMESKRSRGSGPAGVAGYEPESGLKVPPGDDAALFESIANPVITTDTQRENVHFRRTWQTLAQIGQKAAEIAFSDLAACYARPLSLFVNLSIPGYMSDGDIETVYAGIYQVLEKYQATLGGGNISSGREFSIDLFAMGEGHPEIFPLRSNARPGDNLYVTGPLGLARAGLECLKQNKTGYPELIDKFVNPKARFDAAKILAGHSVFCVMDISDGLAGDAAHIAKASNVSIRLDAAFFTIDPVLDKFCRKYQIDPENIMLSGGEDYELLFACRPDTFKKIKLKLPDAFCVGACADFSGVFIENLPKDILSFQHGMPKA